MVKVKVLRRQHMITQVSMKGHAGYADSGYDLVCAGASSIIVGMMNALDQMTPDTCSFQMKKADVTITVIADTIENQTLLNGMILQLKTLQETYQKFIMITDQEV